MLFNSCRLSDGRNVKIRLLAAEDDLNELRDFLHHGYRDLAEMGFRYFASYRTTEDMRRRVSGGKCLIARLEERLVGTLTLYPQGGASLCVHYNLPGVAHFGQFAVEPQLRRAGLGSHLLQMAERLAVGLGASSIALDTAAAAAHLIRFYRRRGYNLVDAVQWEVTNCRSVVMSKQLLPG